MNAFQWIVLPILTVLFLERTMTFVRKKGARGITAFWAVVWLAAGVAVAWPGLTRVIAQAVGINRGADLVFYCAILVMFIGFFMTYVRLRRLDANMTRLVRHLAIRNPWLPRPVEESSPDSEASPSGGQS